MGRLAIVTGHTVRGRELDIDKALGVFVLDRHDSDGYVAAPWIDHHAHAQTLLAQGCDRVLALSSVGGLHERYPLGTVVVPDDFVALAAQPDSQFRDARGHTVPRLDSDWRRRVLAAWRAHADADVVDGGVYWQTTGPRFETRAEIRFIAQFADVVGMTMAAEYVACTEVGLPYAAVAVVDNLANGVSAADLTLEQFEAGKAANRAAVVATLRGVVEELA